MYIAGPEEGAESDAGIFLSDHEVESDADHVIEGGGGRGGRCGVWCVCVARGHAVVSLVCLCVLVGGTEVWRAFCGRWIFVLFFRRKKDRSPGVRPRLRCWLQWGGRRVAPQL